MIPAVFAVLVINFTVMHIAPGNPAMYLAGMEADLEYVKQLEEKWGLNKPIHVQFGIYLGKMLRGDLGYSYRYGQSVVSVIMEKIPATLLLTFSSFLLSIALGIILGVLSSRRPFSLTDNIITIFSLIFYSLPVFWTGMMLIMTLGLYLGIFPIEGIVSLKATPSFWGHIFDILWHLVLPVVSLALVQLAIYYRLTRASMLEELRKDYIITARSKGLEERSVLFKHALKNGMIPIITIVGLRISFLFTGAVLTETVFSWPGLGRTMYRSIFARDYPLLMGIFLAISIVTLISNFFADVAYAIVDPRIRYE